MCPKRCRSLGCNNQRVIEKQEYLFLVLSMDLNVQERPCNALIGVGDANHCGPQDIRNDPKSSNWSRLPEGKNTKITQSGKLFPEVVRVHSFGNAPRSGK